MNGMFCYQCEQTAQGTGCTQQGVCGKDPQTAVLQDLLVYAVKGISTFAHLARQMGFKDNKVDVFVLDGYICSFAFNYWLLRSHRSRVNSVSIIVFLDWR